MIELSPETAIMIYLCAALSVMLMLWITHHFRTRKQSLLVADKRLVTCEYCQCPYLADIETPISECPKCQSLNK